jgi:hypothetical protein
MDTNLVLRDGSSNLTADESLTALQIGPMVHPMELNVLVPAVSSGDVLDVEVEFNDDGSTEIANFNFKQITAAGLYHEPIFTHHDYILVKLNETDNGGPNFGGVKVWLAPVGRYDSDYNA